MDTRRNTVVLTYALRIEDITPGVLRKEGRTTLDELVDARLKLSEHVMGYALCADDELYLFSSSYAALR